MADLDPNRAVSWAHFRQAIDEVIKATAARFKRIEQLAAERIEDLEKRIAAIEMRPELKYCGTWNAQQKYAEGNLCTRRGSLWHANCATHGEPGPGDCDDWTLVAKRGADGKDATR